jgi:hypothetical protein
MGAPAGGGYGQQGYGQQGGGYGGMRSRMVVGMAGSRVATAADMELIHTPRNTRRQQP